MDYTCQKRVIRFVSFALSLLIISVQSCNRKSEPLNGRGEKLEVKISMSSAVFEEIDSRSRAATPYLTEHIINSAIQREEIQLDDDLFLTAELVPQKNSDPVSTEKNTTKQSLKGEQRAALVTTPLTPNVRYRLVVYTANGAYVTEREYIRGQEANTNPLLLDGDSQYTFIAYSVNTTAITPTVTFTDGSQTLAASNVAITGSQDFMYFRQEMTVSGNSTNNLDIVLRHRMSEITTTIDASAIGYNINAVLATFSRHQPAAVVPLSTGLPSRSGAIGTREVTFNSLGAQIVTSIPTIINAEANSLTNFGISSMQIGTITRTGLTPFTNLTVTPGVRYNLILTLTPSDIYVNVANRPAVRINGIVWARHNVGVDTTLNANNVSASNAPLTGNYYQWGRNTVVATAATGAGAITPWSQTDPPTSSWSATSSPCPSGFRLPSIADIESLYSSTISSNFGTWNNSATNYSAYKVFTSRRNANVQITFPIAGNRRFNNGELNVRGESGFYWSYQNQTSSRAYHMSIHESTQVVGHSVLHWAFPLRCVQQ